LSNEPLITKQMTKGAQAKGGQTKGAQIKGAQAKGGMTKGAQIKGEQCTNPNPNPFVMYYMYQISYKQ